MTTIEHLIAIVSSNTLTEHESPPDDEHRLTISTTDDLMADLIETTSSSDYSKTYYELVIEDLTLLDLLPFIGTIVANLIQNCFFLLQNAKLACGTDHTCSSTLPILFCIIDIAASGMQNIFQRFWKSLTWAWIAKLPPETARFVRTLRFFFETHKEQSYAIVIHTPRATFSESYQSFAKAERFMQAYKKDHDLVFECTGDTDMHSADLVNGATHLWYDPSQGIIKSYDTEEIRPVVIPSYLNLEGLIKFPLLALVPLVMFLFQTIAMLSKIFEKKTSTLYIAILICLLGGMCGYAKYITNSRMRLLLAYKNWDELKKLSSYEKTVIYLARIPLNLIYGLCCLIYGVGCLICGLRPLYTKSFYEGIKYTLKPILHLFGLFVGLNIVSFYLYVGLRTSEGINFTLNTAVHVCKRIHKASNSEVLLDGYDAAHPYVDLLCAISSLLFNGILTQMRESINKFNSFAIKLEQYIDTINGDHHQGNVNTGSDLGEQLLSSPRENDQSNQQSVSISGLIDMLHTLYNRHSSTPWWIHIAIIIDVMVFGLSARAAIAGLLKLSVIKHSALARSLPDYYPELAGAGAAISNFIFTYSVAPSDQGKAWAMLWKHFVKKNNSNTPDSIVATGTFSRTSSHGAELSTFPDQLFEESKNETSLPSLLP